MLTEARDLARGARRHRDPRRGDELARAGARRARRPRRGARARSPPCCATRRADARSRSCSTSPSTTARRSRCATGASTEAEAMAAALARVEPAADRARRLGRLRHPDVQRPPRAGPAGRARAGDPDPRRRRASAAARGGPGSSSLLAELGMEAEARRELARVAADGLDAVPRVALARLAHLPDRRLRGARRRGDGGAASTRSSSRSRART